MKSIMLALEQLRKASELNWLELRSVTLASQVGETLETKTLNGIAITAPPDFFREARK